MYRPITMYQIVCDRCGEVFGGTDTSPHYSVTKKLILVTTLIGK